jgi:hypothetical protein
MNVPFNASKFFMSDGGGMARANRHYIPGCVWPITDKGKRFRVQG